MTGHGQHVDQSQMMVGMLLNGPAHLDFSINGRPSNRPGYPPGNRTHWPGTPLVNNYRGRTVAPHNAYRTSPEGYNDWCAIACSTDGEWQQLVGVMGSPAWAIDKKFANLAGRLANQEELDQGIESWTKTLGKYAIMDRCQAVGVRAMPVQSSEDRVDNDPQLHHREMYVGVEHPNLGDRKLQNAPFKLSDTPAWNQLPAPLMGQHNQEILEGMLGINHDDLVTGYEDGTFWPKDMERFPYIEEIIQADPLQAEEKSMVASDGPPLGSGKKDDNPSPHGPLSGLRVLEVTDEKGQWCGKMMGDMGADVIKIEPPGGASTRSVGPFLDDIPNRERSLSFWHYNTSKRGITINLESEDGRDIFRRLAAGTDVLLESFRPGYLPSLGLGYEDLSKGNPGLIMCSLTPFGQTGPWRDYLTSDMLHLAAGGQMASCGYDAADEPDAPPIAAVGGQAWHMGGHFAYIGIAAALVSRTVTGKGQYVDASVHEACALTTEGAISNWIDNGKVVQRQTGRHAAISPSAQTQYRCKDGKYVSIRHIGGLSPQQLQTMATWMEGYGMAGDLLDEKYKDPAVIMEDIKHIDEVVIEFIKNNARDVVYHGFQQLGFSWGAVRTPDEQLEDGHLQDRGFWLEVEHPELGRSFPYPGSAAIWSDSPISISRRAPLIGEHNEEVLCGELGLTRGELSILTEGGAV
jgi:benzylsuccinate CoA-transferase BbsE subunit